MRIDRFLEEKSLFLRFYDMKWLAPSIVRGKIVRRTRNTRKDGRIPSKNSRNRERKCSFRSWSLHKIWKNAVAGLWHARVSSSLKRTFQGILTYVHFIGPEKVVRQNNFPTHWRHTSLLNRRACFGKRKSARRTCEACHQSDKENCPRWRANRNRRIGCFSEWRWAKIIKAASLWKPCFWEKSCWPGNPDCLLQIRVFFESRDHDIKERDVNFTRLQTQNC